MNTRKTSMQDLLRQHDHAQMEGLAEGPHLSEDELRACLTRGTKLTAAQRAHLAGCFECRSIFGELSASEAQEATPSLSRSRGWSGAAWPAGLVAATGVLVAISMSPEPSGVPESAPGWQPRSGGVGVEAEVTLVRTRDGHQTSLRDGGTVRRGDRIGFVYGNIEGEHGTLSVLTANEGQIQWYSPTRARGAPLEIEQGPAARSVRLPMEVLLDDTDRLGRLAVVVAFDARAEALEAWVKGGLQAPPPPNAWVFRLTLSAP